MQPRHLGYIEKSGRISQLFAARVLRAIRNPASVQKIRARANPLAGFVKHMAVTATGRKIAFGRRESFILEEPGSKLNDGVVFPGILSRWLLGVSGIFVCK